jgi:Xaa-Pro aminopeptidase
MKRLALVSLLFTLSLSAQTVTPAEYQSRRDALARVIGPAGVFIALSPEPVTRNGSVEWPFRQDDDLKYLTGLDERQTALVILPAEPEWREMIFTRPFDASAELWTGPIPTTDTVKAISGVAKVDPYDRFDAFLAALFGGKAWGPTTEYRAFRPPGFPNFRTIQREGRAVVWLLLGDRAATAAPVKNLLARLRNDYPELQFRDASSHLLYLREVKSPAELALLQRSIDITDEAHRAAMRRVRSATHEYQLEATIEFTYRDRGADGWGFPSIVGAGRNATTLHYESNNGPIGRNDLVLIDIGAEVNGYTADITRTIPAGGTYSAEQRAIHDAVLRAQNESMKLMRPGSSFSKVNRRAEEVLGEELLKLGLITKNEIDQVRLYYPHGVGHPIGLQVHDVYDRLRPFEEGMVVTNEPGIYVRRADVVASAPYKKMTEAERKGVDAALARYEGIGVRIEDDLLITKSDPRLLSKSPRSAAEIEAFIRSASNGGS